MRKGAVFNEFVFKKKYTANFKKIITFMIVFFTVCQSNLNQVSATEAISKEETIKSIQDIFTKRSKAVLKGDTEFIKTIYDRKTTYGTWVYEYEIKK